MDVVLDTTDGKQLLILFSEDAANVLEEFFFPLWLDEMIARLNSENRLDQDLGVRICHGSLALLLELV
jgi:hypothetical protein